MRLIKRTFALPPDTLQEFEQTVEPQKRDSIVAQVLHEWLQQQKREQIRREIIEGCEEMAEVFLEIEQEYNPLEEEVYRVLDQQPQVR